jgi:hypothetical protein
MKKIAALLLCVFLLIACRVTVCATGELTEEEPEETVNVTTTVPDGLALKVMATNVQICIDGIAAESFTITRQDTPTLELIPAEDFYIKAVYINGEDVTGRVKDGRLTLDPVFEDLELVVLTQPVVCSHLLYWITIAVLAAAVVVLGILLIRRKPTKA